MKKLYGLFFTMLMFVGLGVVNASTLANDSNNNIDFPTVFNSDSKVTITGISSYDLSYQIQKVDNDTTLSTAIDNYYKTKLELEKITALLNKYGIHFVCEKALPGTKIRGCFKVKGKQPAVYVTDNYAGKDSFFFELFHELGHCKSDYNEGKNKIIIDGNEKKEEKADKFALEVMIPENVWNEIINGKIEKNKLEKISQTEKIPMSFIVGRLAKKDLITYRSRLYQDNYQK